MNDESQLIDRRKEISEMKNNRMQGQT